MGDDRKRHLHGLAAERRARELDGWFAGPRRDFDRLLFPERFAEMADSVIIPAFEAFAMNLDGCDWSATVRHGWVPEVVAAGHQRHLIQRPLVGMIFGRTCILSFAGEQRPNSFSLVGDAASDTIRSVGHIDGETSFGDPSPLYGLDWETVDAAIGEFFGTMMRAPVARSRSA